MIGPWRHSGANHYGYELGDTDLHRRHRRRNGGRKYVKPFLDHYLKGAPDPHTPPVLTYATGINDGRRARAGRWARRRRSISTAGNGAGFDRPASAGHDDYVSDPAKPVPFIPRPRLNDARPVEALAGARPALRRRTAPTCCQLHHARR